MWRYFIAFFWCFAANAITIPIAITNSPINVSSIASRTVCVAPCAVFFDETGTTDAGVTSNPYADIQYVRNFGDTNVIAATTCGSVVAGEGFWACGSRPGVASKNVAYGQVSTHIYEAGSYSTCATYYDGTNTVSPPCTTITVTAATTQWPTTKTICFSTTALSSGCDTGATYVGSVTDLATSVAANIGDGNVRLLLKRGDNFSTTTAVTLSASGPGMIGAFGSGSKPVITVGSSINGIRINSGVSDWRIVDIDINGGNFASSRCISNAGVIIRITILRFTCRGALFGIAFDVVEPRATATQNDQIAIVDSDFQDSNSSPQLSYPIFGSSTRFALLGTKVDGTSSNHAFRSGLLVWSVLSDNTITGPTATSGGEVLKIHGLSYSSSGNGANNYSYIRSTQYLVVSDNDLSGVAGLASQNNNFDERLDSVVWERNWQKALAGPGGSGSQVLYMQAMTNAVVRNNICDVSDGDAGNVQCWITTSYTPTIYPHTQILNNIQYYNNTAYTSKTDAGSFRAIQVDPSATNLTIKNNLGFAPNITTVTLMRDTEGIATAANNTCNTSNCTTNMKTDPTFGCPSGCANNVAFTPTNARITGTYPLNGGTSVPVWSDFFLTAQPATRTIGAVNP